MKWDDEQNSSEYVISKKQYSQVNKSSEVLRQTDLHWYSYQWLNAKTIRQLYIFPTKHAYQLRWNYFSEIQTWTPTLGSLKWNLYTLLHLWLIVSQNKTSLIERNFREMKWMHAHLNVMYIRAGAKYLQQYYAFWVEYLHP